MARLLIADDHRLTVEGMVKLLWNEWPDLLMAHTVADTIRLLGPPSIHLLVLDLHFLDIGKSGFDVLEYCHRYALPTRILVTSAYTDSETVRAVREWKAHGFLGKHQPGAELIAAIRHLLAGGESWPPEAPSHPTLTPSQRRALLCMAAGMTCAAAAESLGIAEVSVEKALAEARKRLDARNTAHAVVIAERRGLLIPRPTPEPGRGRAPAETRISASWDGGGGG
ncbi:MAG: response regulator, partial [Gemmatimonadales bacterium]